jgi:lipoprotein NlpI
MMTHYRRTLLTTTFFCVILFDTAKVCADRAEELAERAMAAASRGASAEAIELATRAIQLDPTLAAAYKTRGRALFCTARISESIADFDKYVLLMPELEPRQWERGIAYYYAGKYKQGAAQFERYQSFEGHDVENSVWRFLCMAPDVGVAAAQATMLPIENDRRMPMMQIFDLFRGKCSPEDVLTAANSGKPDEMTLAGRLFYTHLYLGLWFDANKKKADAKRYIDLSATETLKSNPHINRYMWEVARIHQKLLRGELIVNQTSRPEPDK